MGPHGSPPSAAARKPGSRSSHYAIPKGTHSLLGSVWSATTTTSTARSIWLHGSLCTPLDSTCDAAPTRDATQHLGVDHLTGDGGSSGRAGGIARTFPHLALRDFPMSGALPAFAWCRAPKQASPVCCATVAAAAVAARPHLAHCSY